ncbi:MAG: hypothetical protein CTY20_10265 [Hyphomicrobium sp.]|nr:MAG: hypothetical protein CTY20_10265 [Hyphomicrobium sp.]
MPQIRIDRTPIIDYRLGFFGADHLFLSYVQDENAREQVQDGWFTIEGLRSVGTAESGFLLGVEGTDGRTTISQSNHGLTGSDLVRIIGTPTSRLSAVIEFPQGAFEAWETLSVYGEDIDNNFLPYFIATRPGLPIPTSNSSSVVASVLFYAGIDIADHLPTGFRRFTTGTQTLLGTPERDELFVTSNFKNLLGGRGSDILHGGDGTNRLSGGLDADLFLWSPGLDFIHGGQVNTPYQRDGEDVAAYGGAGVVRVDGNPIPISHYLPNLLVTYQGGRDLLFSIERLQWNQGNDEIIIGESAVVSRDNTLFDLKGDEGGRGDKVSFNEVTDELLINAVSSDRFSIKGQAVEGDATWFFDSVEWIEGSSRNDTIYANSGLRVIDGGDGDDFIDARLDLAFAGGSPGGYDIELYGGDGNDTLLTSEGRTFVQGGEGADRIVLTTISDGRGTPELIIDDADTDDRLFVAYNFFNGSGGGFEGSQLLPVLGGLFPFELLMDPEEEGRPLLFEWQRIDDILFGSSQVTGQINFLGAIQFTLDGSDLIIRLHQGTPETVNIADEGSEARFFELNIIDASRETLIRVRDFQPGDLGIQFYDPGEPQAVETPFGGAFDYPDWDAGVAALTNNGQLFDPIGPRPATNDYDPSNGSDSGDDVELSGTDGGEVITASLRSNIDAGAGDDDVTGSAFGDTIDGGSGNDVLAGGAGDDRYVVDATADRIVERGGEGRDLVISSVDHTLSANVEGLELVGSAAIGIGNRFANTIQGNLQNNTLDGGDGNDALFGDLGDDTLIGGAGSDYFAVFREQGDEIIIDAGLVGDVDTLALTGEIVASEVSFYRRTAAPDDLVLAIAGGGRVVIKDFALAGSGIDRVVFDDGTSWSRADIEAAGAVAPILDNDPPRATPDDSIGVSGPVGIVRAATLLQNDRDADGDQLAIVAVGGAEGGAVTLEENGDIRVVTASGFQGTVSFDYTIADIHGGRSTARVTADIRPNSAPLVFDTIPDVTSAEDAVVDFTLPPGIFGDDDPLLIFASLSGGADLPAWLTFDAVTGRFTGTPPPNFSGTLAIRIEATDGLDSAVQHFSLTITPVNDVPVAAEDVGFATTTGTALVIAATALIANDTDIDGDTLTIASVGGAIGGTVALEADGRVRFTPATGFSGEASFSYTVADGKNGTATATVLINVTSAAGRIYAGTSGNDAIVGTVNDDVVTLVGDSGFDTIDGGGGLDSIRGSIHNDIVRISAPASYSSIERIEGGDGNDRILGGTGNDVIDLTGITLISIEQIDGGAGNDTITGSAGDDVITGNTGNDTLSGGLGNDVFTLAGDGGNDIIDGGAGIDTIRGSISNDNIRIAAGAASIASIERIEGGDGNDRILGGTGNDVIDLGGVLLTSIEQIDGGAGNDTIVASLSADVLTGGAGVDTFVFRTDSGHDVVSDFRGAAVTANAGDQLDLRGLGFAGFEDVIAASSQISASDGLITVDSQTSIRLQGVVITTLTADDILV